MENEWFEAIKREDINEVERIFFELTSKILKKEKRHLISGKMEARLWIMCAARTNDPNDIVLKSFE